jgi:serine/threonine protein kinase
LPEAGIACAYRLLARARLGRSPLPADDLRVPGLTLIPQTTRSTSVVCKGFFDTLFTMDCQGLMHYDLKPANILFDGDRHGLIDFEFARFEPWHDAYATATAAYCEDSMSRPIPTFPSRTNVANFEFRTLSAYIACLERARRLRAPTNSCTFICGSGLAITRAWVSSCRVSHREPRNIWRRGRALPFAK